MLMNRKYFILTIVLLFLCIGSFQPFGCKTTITGIVTDSRGNPVSGATVSIDAEGIDFTNTNTDGLYTFENVPYGQYTITVVCDGYNDTTSDIDTSYFETGLACKDTDGVNIQMGAIIYSWQEIGTSSTSGGGISNNSGVSWFPSMAINNLGNPVVAWSDSTSGNNEIYVKQWNGSTWEEMSAGSASAGGISNNSGISMVPFVAVDNLGNPIIAWMDGSSGNDEIYVKKWDGSNWVEMGTGSASGSGISNNSGQAMNPKTVIDNSGNPIIVWGVYNSGYKIYIKKWSGSSWVEISSGSASGNGISNSPNSPMGASITINNSGNPIIAWYDFTAMPPTGNRSLYCIQWNGSNWENFAGGVISSFIGDTSGTYFGGPSIISNLNNVYIAWEDNSSSNDEIYVKKWNGSIWEELNGSASSGGISNNSGISKFISMTINNSGNPIVTWCDDTSGNYEIYVKQWNGSSWEEIGTGSASGGGISNNTGGSGSPILAIDNSGMPIITWYDTTSGNSEIYIKKYAPAN